METIFGIMSFIFGLLIGSFLNVVILRLPKDQSLMGRSFCPNCKHSLNVLDLFPLFSFLLLKGQCRYCGKKISPRYAIIEFITGLLFLFSYAFVQPQDLSAIILLASLWIALSTLLCVFVIDLEHFLILDNIIFFGGLSLTVLNLLQDILSQKAIWSLHSHFIGGLLAAVLCALPFFAVWYISQGKWMGFGDVKLALFLGIALGYPNVFIGLMIGVLLGGALSGVLLVFTKSTLKTRLPFGTFLAVGSAVALFYGPAVLNWYLSILGI